MTPFSESASFEVFHDEVGKPVSPRVDAEIGHVDDVRMFQFAESFGFDAKSRQKRLVATGRDQLQCERLLQAEMVSTVHDSHPAVPQALVKAVLAIENRGTSKRR